MLNSELAEFSHDLRVPMTSIIAHLEMLEDELGPNPDPVVAGSLARAMGASERMRRMLDQAMEIGHREVQRPPVGVDLCQVARQLAVDSARLLDLAGAMLEISWLPFVHADPDEMYCVLQNLLTNAVKFARPGVWPRISISARPVTSGWHVSVSDNGVGIPADRRLDVFTLFTRADARVEGHGIGLASVARTVHALDGRVGVGESPAGGAEVWFELPEDADARP
jgi:signal transduction histidine kinase